MKLTWTPNVERVVLKLINTLSRVVLSRTAIPVLRKVLLKSVFKESLALLKAMVMAGSHGERRKEREELKELVQVRLLHEVVLTVQSYQSKSELS